MVYQNGTSHEGAGDAPEELLGYFSAGPAKLPDEVLRIAQDEFRSYRTSKVGVMELSHRSPEYMAINDEAIACIRQLFNVPSNYKIIFMQGGGTGQMATVPLNLLPEGGTADYIVTGTWSEKAAKEAKKYGNVNVIKPDKFTSIPDESTWNRSENASYLYYCDNETVHGVEFQFVPSTQGKYADIPIVADMSSNFGSRPVDISKFGLVFATVQKNLGPSGCTIVIVREDLIGKQRSICPSIFDYQQMVKANSLLNTPVTFSVYMTKLVMEWVERYGGLVQMQKNSATKSKMLYDIIDSSDGFYTSLVVNDCRSRVNVVFRIKGGDESIEAEFLAAAKKVNLLALKGHRSVGGVRASIYNAVSIPAVEKLAKFMKDFKTQHSNA